MADQFSTVTVRQLEWMRVNTENETLRAEVERLRAAARLGLDCLLDYGEVNAPMSKAIRALRRALKRDGELG